MEAGPGFGAGAGIGFRIPLTGGLLIRADASYFTSSSRMHSSAWTKLALILHARRENPFRPVSRSNTSTWRCGDLGEVISDYRMTPHQHTP